MTDAEWGAERLALLAEWEELEAEHARFAVAPPPDSPDDSTRHRLLRARLNAYAARVRAYRDALRLLSDT